MRAKSHYDYLNENLADFLKKLGQPEFVVSGAQGLISAHGDKFYSYRSAIEEAGMTFGQGVAIGLLSYLFPYSKECRETESGWVDVCDWIVANKNRFVSLLPNT